MTDDPIRERVARALFNAALLDVGRQVLWRAGDDAWPDEEQRRRARLCADAALRECGYEEMRRALEEAEKAERYHMNCKHCDGLEQPEACEKCFPKADDARLARWAALKAIGSRLAPREPRAALSRTQGEG